MTLPARAHSSQSVFHAAIQHAILEGRKKTLFDEYCATSIDTGGRYTAGSPVGAV